MLKVKKKKRRKKTHNTVQGNKRMVEGKTGSRYLFGNLAGGLTRRRRWSTTALKRLGGKKPELNEDGFTASPQQNGQRH